MGLTRRHFLHSAGAWAGASLLGGSIRLRADEPNPALAEAMGGWPDSPFLRGNYAPVFDEVTADDLPVEGVIPESLRGLYVRNGPNPQFAPTGNYHWFDGDGMLHGVYLRDGRASYRNRFVLSDGLAKEREAGRVLWGGLNDPPDFKRVLAGEPPYKNAGNTAFVWHDGNLLALWEGGPPHLISVPELGTEGLFDFGGTLKHACTAHPKIDPDSGEMYLFGYSPVPPYLVHSIVDREGLIRKSTTIALPEAVMMHDFAITKNYVIFLDLPATFDFARLVRGEPLLSYERDRVSRFGILPKGADGSAIRWFEASSCYVFHTVNAFERGSGSTIVLDAIRYDGFPTDLGMGGAPEAGDGPGFAVSPHLYRWTFDLKTGEVTGAILNDRPAELPRINETLVGRPHRYAYAMGGDMTHLVKYDFANQSTLVHSYGPSTRGGEPLFVPDPDGQTEDDGWLLSYVHDEVAGRSALVIVDARHVDDDPIARVQLPQRVPYGFHGIWVDESRWQ